MRVVFMGTGDIALPSFRYCLANHEVVGLVTQPDRPVGRHQELHAPKIKELAVEAGVTVLQPERVRRKAELAALAALSPDLIVVMAYGQILPKALLEMPRHGCINLHASLLPRHRGASCIQAAIEAGDAESGVTIIQMDEGLDTGAILFATALSIGPEETGGQLHDRLAELSPESLKVVMESFEKTGEERGVAQDDSLASYAPKLERKDGEVDWSQSAEQLERRIRAYDPWPGSFTMLQDERGRPRRVKLFPSTRVREGEGQPGEVLQAGADGLVVACGEGALSLEQVQPEGGRRLPVEAFLAGHRLEPGSRFFSLENKPE